MSNFDKFMKRIEEQERLRKIREEQHQHDDSIHHQRERVRRYQEYWSNRVRWGPRSQKK